MATIKANVEGAHAMQPLNVREMTPNAAQEWMTTVAMRVNNVMSGHMMTQEAEPTDMMQLT